MPTLPGTNYCGPQPFVDEKYLETFPPVNVIDVVCRDHDVEYSNIIRNGNTADAYLRFNEADARLLARLDHLARSDMLTIMERTQLRIVSGFFRAKRRFAPTVREYIAQFDEHISANMWRVDRLYREEDRDVKRPLMSNEIVSEDIDDMDDAAYREPYVPPGYTYEDYAWAYYAKYGVMPAGKNPSEGESVTGRSHWSHPILPTKTFIFLETRMGFKSIINEPPFPTGGLYHKIFVK